MDDHGEADVKFESAHLGRRLPERSSRPISRATLALFAGGSGDHNPIHIDSDFAKEAGAPDVFAQGMLSMAYLAQTLTGWVRQDQIRAWNVRFVSITPLHATVVCWGEVIEKFEEAGERRVRLSIGAKIAGGPDTLVGEAVVALP